MRRRRLVSPDPPDELGVHAGLAYALFLPSRPPLGRLVILHGAGSAKESHFDFARAARARGLATVAFDLRGHGASDGTLDHRAIDDVAAIAALLPSAPLALRGSSMGGYLALIAARALRARAVVAICPASGADLSRMLRRGEQSFRADAVALTALYEEHDVSETVRAGDAALLLMHAEGDERVPVTHSRQLFAAARTPDKRLLVLPGGHHRSVQRDGDLQAFSLRFIIAALAGRRVSDPDRDRTPWERDRPLGETS